MSEHVARIVTFSGIDGAGKTTQIESAAAHLTQLGFRVARVAFWDDVAVFSHFRAGVSLRVLQKKKTLKESAVLRNDKNVRVWYLTMVRGIFYLLDSFRLRSLINRLGREDLDFIIFDRYIYDQIVQVRARHWFARCYIRLLATIAPVPDFGFILDASPEEAFRRKPEYPLSFMHDYRQAFLSLTAFVPQLIVISPGAMAEVHQRILAHLLRGFSVSTEHFDLAASASRPQ
jgi:thymidylate kinase